jgi:hypothetical protein
MMHRLVVAATAGIVAFYAVLGLVVLAPEAVYSGDIGVKYVQARALVRHHFTSLDIPYPGQFLDPHRAFSALQPPFVMRTGGETQAIFPPVSALLQAVAVGVAGLRGMIALSIVAAAVVLLSACAMAPPPQRLAVVMAVGLGGPLWFYAVSGWEHATGIAFGTAAFAWALRSDRASLSDGTAPLVSGALMGAGAALREEVALLVPGLLLVIWLRAGDWRPLRRAVAGVLLPLLLSAAVEVWWFNRPAAAHLRHAVHLLQSALHLTNAPNPDVPALEPFTLRERYDTVVTYWLFGRGTDGQVAVFTLGLIAALAIRWRWRSSAGVLLWLLAFAATTAGDVWEVVTAPKWLAGLVRVSPFVVCALFPWAPGDARHPRGSLLAFRGPVQGGAIEALFPAAVLATTAAFLVVAFAGVDTSGGKSLGPRLLLPLWPLLSVSAIMIVASHLRSTLPLDRLVGYAGAALVGAALVIHLGGTIPAYKQRNADDAAAVLAVAASPERIVVADDMYTAQLLFPLYERKIVLLADSVMRAAGLGQVLDGERIRSVLLVTRNPETPVALPPLRMTQSDRRGRMILQTWSR